MFGKRSRPRAAEILEGLGGLDLLNTILKEIRSMKLDFSALQAVVTGIQGDVATMADDMTKVLSMIGNVGAASETDQAQLDQVTAALQGIKSKLDGTNADMSAAVAAAAAPANPVPAAGGSSTASAPGTPTGGAAATASSGAPVTGSASTSSAPVAGQPTAAASS